MKNILLITSLYPSDDVKFLNNTSVCHYFAREWVNLGYSVRVIYSYRIYPWYYYPIIKFTKKYLAKTHATAILDKKLDTIHSYDMDGVHIDRVPIKKSRPYGEFSSNAVITHCDEIRKLLDDSSFVPDVILGHFITPSLYIVTRLKEFYPNVKTAVSMHGQATTRGYRTDDEKLFSLLDFMGYRSHSIRKSYEARYGKRPYLMCPSGVPSEYIVDKPRSFEKGIRNFIYVGSFIDRKHPCTVVEALAKCTDLTDFTLTFVGDGAGRNKIIKTANKYNCVEKIKFTGRIPRNLVAEEMNKAEVFIMVSENETFGLVYLEAMARGCITVASKNEGMDGIINDGINGFLCNAGDVKELSLIIDKIRRMSQKQLSQISSNAIETARKYSDTNVAVQYLANFAD